MASTDARPVPIKNTAFRAIFPIYDADGDLVTGAASLDSEVSLDQAGFSDCTNEATEIATSSGIYYLDLTAAEMNADCSAVIVKTGTAGAKTTVLVFYPEEAGDINVDVTAFGGTAGTFASGRPEVNTTHAAGTAWGSGAITAAAIAADAITAAKIADSAIDAATFAAGAINAAAIAADAITAAKIADGAIDAATFAAGAINAAAIAADAIGASELATDAVNEIADAVWDEARAGHVAAGSFGEGVASVQGNVTGSVGSVVGAVGSVTGAVGSVTGAVGSVTGAVGSVTGNVGGNVTGSVGSLAAQAKTDVNAEVVDALATDTYAESASVPAATATLAAKIQWLATLARNKIEQTSTTQTLRKDDGTTALATATVSDDGTTATRGEFT